MKKFVELVIFVLIMLLAYFLVINCLYKIVMTLKPIYRPRNIKAETISDLLNTAYTINTTYNGKTESYQHTGSGIAFWAEGNAYILTCGHVVECLRVREYERIVADDINESTVKITYRWDKAQIEKTIYKNNREHKRNKYYAKVVAYSAQEQGFDKHKGIDLAVLKVENPADFPPYSAKFLPQGEKLSVGDRIYHVSSLYGDFTESYVEGYISRLDLQYLNTYFNVVKLGACPGSSGGGIFTYKNGKYYYSGMLTRGDSGTTDLIKPLYIIRDWLKDNNLISLTESKQ